MNEEIASMKSLFFRIHKRSKNGCLGSHWLLLFLFSWVAVFVSCSAQPSVSPNPGDLQSPARTPSLPPQAPILRLETGVHTEDIVRIAVDRANNFLITGSTDKTIRVWDIHNKSLVKTLRPPIASGHEGKILAVAISPDGKTIAAGGYTGTTWDQNFSIYIFSRLTGQMTQKLSGLPSSLGDLEFSPDGTILLATLHGRIGWYAYRTSDFSLIAKDESYYPTSYVYGVAFDQAGRFVTSSYDGFIRLYDDDFHVIAKVQLPVVKRPHGLVFSPDGTQIAVGFDDSPQIALLSGADLSWLPAQPKNEDSFSGTFTSLAWSQDGKSFYGGGTARKNGEHFLRVWSFPNVQHFSDIPLTNNTILDLVSLKSGGIGYGAASGSFGLLDAAATQSFSSELAMADFRDNHQGLLLSEDGSIVQFGTKQFGKEASQFSIQTRVLSFPPVAASPLHPPIHTSQEIHVEDWLNTTNPTINGKRLSFDTNEVSRSRAISPDHQSALFGTSWNLRLYDRRGRQIWQTAIPGNAWGVNISNDAQVAIATLGDGTIRWYRLKDGKELLAFFPHPDHERWVIWTPSGFYDAAPGSEQFIGWHKNYEAGLSADFFPVGRFRTISYRPKIIETMLATWDEKEAIRLADGANQNIVKQVEPIPADILQTIQSLQEQLEHAVAKKQETKTTSSKLSLGEKETLFAELPPEVVIFSPRPTFTTSDPIVTIHYAVITHSLAPVKEITVLIDGKPLPETRGIRVLGNISTGQDHQTVDVPIPQKNSIISLVAKHRWATSEPATVKIQWDQTIAKPNLYILAIGPGEYTNPRLNVSTASKDAEIIASTLTQQAQGLYDRVETKVLINSQATRDNILDGLDWLHQQTTQKDVAMIFFVGHSVSDKGGFPYLLTPESQMTHLRRTSLALSDITNAVVSMAGTTVMFLDACQSNTPPGSMGCIQGVNTLSQELGNASRPVVAFLATSGSQRAIHDPSWNHSAFTTALVEGMSGQVNVSDAGIVSLNRLELYLSERIKVLTQGHQRPTTIKPHTIQDFPLALAADGQPIEGQTGISPTVLQVQPAQEILNRLPPIVTILSPSDQETVNSSNLTIRYSVRNPSGEPVTEMVALVDGRPAPKSRGVTVLKGQVPQTGIQEFSLTIPERTVTISLIAKNRWSASEPTSIRLRWDRKDQKSAQKPKLYVLAVGISAYEDPTLALEFAAKDAQDFSTTLHDQMGGLYETVTVKEITDHEATKDEILKGLEWIDSQTSATDVAMIFLAGHGVNDSGGIYYFLPVNAETNRLRRTGLSYSHIKNTVATLKGKTLLFVDSCHAGDVMGMRRGVADINALVNELTSAENGAVVFASSTGRQFALEDPAWGNGAFTKALIEGLQGGADYRKTGAITVNMLDLYLSERVKALTNGQQTPTTTKPHTIQDFPIALTGAKEM